MLFALINSGMGKVCSMATYMLGVQEQAVKQDFIFPQIEWIRNKYKEVLRK